MGERGGHWQSVPGEQGGGAGAGRQIPGQAVRTERRGETALPDGPAIKGRNTPARLPPRFPAPGKCTSHLGFGLGSRFSEQQKGPLSGPGALLGSLAGTAVGFRFLFYGRWADGKLLGNALNPCAGATESPLASPWWHSLPLGWNRAYSGVRFTKAEADGTTFRRPRRVLPWLVRLSNLFQQRL